MNTLITLYDSKVTRFFRNLYSMSLEYYPGFVEDG